jgi:serine/threonine-protein kinase
LDDSPEKQELPATAPKPGDVFAEKYRIEGVLGVGGMGYVLSATHVELQQRVAIKMLLPERASDADTVARFMREGRTAAKIRSEHVARVLDVGSTAGTPFIVMEHLDGDDLAVVLRKRKRLSVAVAVDYLLQACEAIAEAHAMRTVHRDLKPANLFVVARPGGGECVKVLDFGISKMAPAEGALALTRTTSTVGTPLYMSPEQLTSSKSVDMRADIWALGVILFELVAGRTPFRADSLAQLGAHVLTANAPDVRTLVPEVPAGIADAIATCLRRDPRERFPSLAELAAAVAPFGSAAAATSAEQIRRVLAAVPRSSFVIPAGFEIDRNVEALSSTLGLSLPSAATEAARRSSRAAWVGAGLLVLAVVGGGAGVIVAKLSGRTAAPAGPSSGASSFASVAASAGSMTEPSTAPVAAPPAPSASAASAPPTRVVQVTIAAPADAKVDVDGSAVAVRAGKVEIEGALGSVHRVRVSAGGRETTTEVILADSGPSPARVALAPAGRSVKPGAGAPGGGGANTGGSTITPVTPVAKPDSTSGIARSSKE